MRRTLMCKGLNPAARGNRTPKAHTDARRTAGQKEHAEHATFSDSQPLIRRLGLPLSSQNVIKMVERNILAGCDKSKTNKGIPCF